MGLGWMCRMKVGKRSKVQVKGPWGTDRAEGPITPRSPTFLAPGADFGRQFFHRSWGGGRRVQAGWWGALGSSRCSFTRSPAAHFLPCAPFLTGPGPVPPALTERQPSGLQKGWVMGSALGRWGRSAGLASRVEVGTRCVNVTPGAQSGSVRVGPRRGV